MARVVHLVRSVALSVSMSAVRVHQAGSWTRSVGSVRHLEREPRLLQEPRVVHVVLELLHVLTVDIREVAYLGACFRVAFNATTHMLSTEVCESKR